MNVVFSFHETDEEKEQYLEMPNKNENMFQIGKKKNSEATLINEELENGPIFQTYITKNENNANNIETIYLDEKKLKYIDSFSDDDDHDDNNIEEDNKINVSSLVERNFENVHVKNTNLENEIQQIFDGYDVEIIKIEEDILDLDSRSIIKDVEIMSVIDEDEEEEKENCTVVEEEINITDMDNEDFRLEELPLTVLSQCGLVECSKLPCCGKTSAASAPVPATAEARVAEAGVLASLQALVARRRAEGARRPTKASLARRREVRRMFPHLGSAATRTESGGAGVRGTLRLYNE